MRIYDVDYPFEVDAELGRASQCYPTLRAARADAQSLYERRAAEEADGDYPDHMREVGKPAVVQRCAVTRLTPAAVCAILNSEGHFWMESAQAVGRFVWDGKVVRYQAAAATPTESP